MKFVDQKQTIKNITYFMSNKQRFAFVGFSRSSLMALSGQIPDEKKPGKQFLKYLSNSLEIKDQNYMRAVYYGMISHSTDLNLKDIPSISQGHLYDAGTFENYFLKKRDVFDSFSEYYLKYSSTLVVSFHDKKLVQKVIGQPSYYIKVPYNDYYDRVDNIMSEIREFDSEVDYCILDCPMLSSALAGHIWSKTSMSILDLGKVFTSSLSKLNA